MARKTNDNATEAKEFIQAKISEYTKMSPEDLAQHILHEQSGTDPSRMTYAEQLCWVLRGEVGFAFRQWF